MSTLPDRTSIPSADADNNVDTSTSSSEDQTEQKRGIMDKLKDKLMPDGPDKAPMAVEGHNIKYSANIAGPGYEERHSQANADLNRE